MAKVSKKRSNKKRVQFELDAPGADTVSVAGDFNRWDTKKGVMKKNSGGRWKKILYLEAGEHEYKFLVDGEWIADPAGELKRQNCYGTQNSVLTVG